MTDVVMPQMGESITEGTLTKWLKKAGDAVEADEPLFEISTDKVDTEIPSPVAGTLAEMLVEEGQTVTINTVVARIAESGEKAESPVREPATAEQPSPAEAPGAPVAPRPSPSVAPPVPAAPPPTVPGAIEGPISPLVRRLAREHNIDLRLVTGTGAGGRITKQDIEAYLAARPVAAASAAPVPAPTVAPAAGAPITHPDRQRVEPMSTMRRKIAEHMVFSKHTSPHVTTVHKADMTAVVHLRNKLKAGFKQRYGFSLTYLSFVMRATAQVLREFPIVNASIDGTNIIYHNEINIGIAVALDGGLIVPVIRNADTLSVVGLQSRIVDLANRARSRRLKPDEVQDGTFSITNFGSFGGLFATPVINQPNVAILGVGAVGKEPVVTPDDAIAIRSTAYLSLTFDHRLVDGAVADQFTERVKQILENWTEQVL